MNSDTILIIVTFITAVLPLYYKIGKLEVKVNSLCNRLNPRSKKRGVISDV
ncbi:hypothetical protein ES703_82416 [subsurface metagenome]